MASEATDSSVGFLSQALLAAAAEQDDEELLKLFETANCLYNEAGRWQGAAEEEQPFPVETLFACLGALSEGAPWQDACCTLTTKTLLALSPHDLVASFANELMLGLHHPVAAVRKLTLAQILRVVRSDATEPVEALIHNEELFPAAIRTVADEELSVGAVAVDVVQSLCLNASSRQAVLGDAVQSMLTKLCSESSTTQMRVLDCWVRAANASPHVFEEIAAAGLLDSVIGQAVQKKDVLLRLTSLELVSQIAQTSFGYEHLLKKNVVESVLEPLCTPSDDIETTLLREPAMEFLCSLATHAHKNGCDFAALNQQLGFWPPIVAAAIEETGTTKVQALNTIGLVARASTGIELMSAQDAVEAVQKPLLQVGDHDLGVVAMHAFANCCDSSVDKVEGHAALREQVYRTVNAESDVLERVMKAMTSQIQEKQNAGFHCLHALSSDAWGRGAIASHPGLIEFLTDRSLELDYELQQLRFTVVETMARNPVATLDPRLALNLSTFARAGAFASQALERPAEEFQVDQQAA